MNLSVILILDLGLTHFHHYILLKLEKLEYGAKGHLFQLNST